MTQNQISHCRPARIRRAPPTRRTLSSLIAVLMLGACASPGGESRGRSADMIPLPLFGVAAPQDEPQAAAAAAAALSRGERRMVIGETPPVPPSARNSTVRPGSAPAAASEPADTTLAFDQLPLPSFVQLVFGSILKKSFSVDPAVMTRTDLVTLRTGTAQTATQVLDTTRLLLKSYGVAVNDLGGGAYRIVPDTNQSAYLPEIRRGRAQPDVPMPLRPVFNLVEMSAVKYTDVSAWLKAMFGARLTIQDDPARNALLLSGQAADVTAALEAVQVLDQPLMRARSSQLVSPSTLGADDLARRLVEILAAEGYAAGVGAAPGLPISLVSIPASNSLLVFAADPAVLAHVTAWAAKLDSLETDNRRSGTYFSYEVKYADAQSLAKTMQELMSSQSVATESAPAAAGVRVIGASTPRQQGRFVVNASTNTLIFSTGNPDEYAQLLGIMKTLDKPAKSAMIEVTVAEVNVGDASQLGIEWNFGPDALGKGLVTGGTTGGLSIGSGGLTLSYLNSAGVLRAKLNALASDNRARILSSPRVMARNGEAATIQVGQEVPIITSQQTTAATGTAAPLGAVLQTIQYRSTGVILRVKPIIFAGRVELEVQQEVSSAAATSTGVNVSPTFSTRKVDTKLSIRDGATVALGGLISRTENNGAAGIPLLKDIPLAGQFFRTDTRSVTETELIILITPYVVENDLVAEQVTQAMRGQLGRWAQPLPSDVQALPVKRSAALPVPVAPAEAAPPTTVPAQRSLEPPPLVQPAVVPAAPATVTPAPAAPLLPTGRPVTDPALLEALRRAAAGQAQAVSAPASAAGERGPVKKAPIKPPQPGSR